MRECKNCRHDIPYGAMMECPSCGATFCSNCATGVHNICPFCYSSLTFQG